MARTFASASTQYLRANSAGAPNLPITISAWAKTSITSGIFAIATQGHASATDFCSLEIQAGKIRNQQQSTGGTARNCQTTQDYPLNQWFHCAATCTDLTNRAAWIDGQKTTQATTTGGTSTPYSTTGIGALIASGAASRPWDGSIAEVAVWDVVLTDDEIIALSKGISPLLIRPQNLTAYWPLVGEAASAPAIDRWRNRIDLSVVSTAGATQDHPIRFARTRPKVVGLFVDPPATPTAPTPADGATGLLNPITLAWSALGATSYDVKFGTSATPPTVSTDQSAATYNPGALTPGTTYFWQIVARNVIGSTPGPVWSFTLLPPPAVPAPSAPTNGAVDLVAPVSLTWGAVSGASGYDVRFGTTSGSLPTVSSNQPGTSYAATTTPGATYFWQVRSKNAAGDSAWSAEQTFTMLALPATPNTPSPPNGATITPATLTWVSALATSYDVYFGTSPSPPLVSSDQPGASYTTGIGSDGFVYYWKIVAKNAAGTTTGPVWSFTAILAAPLTPHDPSPADGAVDAFPAALTWTAEGATSYDVKFGATSPPPTVSTGQPGASYAPTLRRDGQIRYWQINAINGGGATLGPIWSFTTPNPPAVNTPIPSDGALAGPVAIAWSAAPDADAYDVYFGSTNPPPLVASNVATTSHAITGLVEGVTYYWRVATKIGAGVTLGAVWSFVATKPAAPVLPSPPTGASSVPPKPPPTLTWEQPASPVIEGPVTWDVYFGYLGSVPPLVASDLTSPSYTPPADLTGDLDYVWRVVAKNAVGDTVGVLWTFHTKSVTALIIEIEGEPVRVRKAGCAIRDLLTNQPNTCNFTMEGSAPSVGQEVAIGLGNLDPENVIFGGVIDTVSSIYEEIPANRAWVVTCQDHTFGLNRRKVRTRYGEQSATLIARDLMTRYAPSGYTSDHIPDGLPIVEGGIDFTEEDLTECLVRLAQRIGGYFYVDYQKDVHVFTSEEVEAPDPIVEGSRALMNEPSITAAIDLTQVRTRVFVEGGGGQARDNTPAGSTEIAVTDSGWYSGTGGLVVSGPQRIAYTGKGAASGAAAPTVSIDVNAFGKPLVGNLVGGPYSYKVSFVISGAETALGAASAAVNFPNPQDPVAAIGISLHSGGGLNGTHRWRAAFQTAHGDTGGNAEAIHTAPAPGSPGYAYDLNFSAILTEAAKDPRYTAIKFYRTNSDRTVYFPLRAVNTGSGWTPTAEGWIPLPFAGGTAVSLDAWVDGDLGPIAMQPNSVIGYGKVTLSAIPLGPAGTTARKIYRTTAGGTVYKLVGTINNNTTTTFADNVADSALGAAPSGEVATNLTGIPASGPGAIVYDILGGDEVNLLVQCDDLDAQAELAALEGAPSDGIIEHYIQDRRLGLGQAQATGNADLVLFARPLQTINYTTRDPKTRSGKTVSINLPSVGIVGDYTIQTVDIDEIDAARGTFPRYRVTASSVRFSLEDVIRRLQLET